MGWDGQFYYTQSNDPLLLDDYSGSRLFDNISYRYQRNGLPMLARCSAFLTGQQLTSPLVYYLTEMALVSLGFGALVGFLVHQRLCWAWACLWGVYGGVLRPMLHGLPDPAADALLLCSVLAVLNGRLWLYAIAGGLLCLCRESYAAPAAALWLLTLARRIPWCTQSYWLRIVWTAVPGAVALGWASYVAFRTHTSLLAGSRSIPWGGLIDWPFKAYLTSLWSDLRMSDENDVIYATSCALLLAIVLAIVGYRAMNSPPMLAIVPHLVLMTMTGSIVWEAGVGYFKNTSSIVLLGILLLSVSPSRSLRLALWFTFLAGLHYAYRADIRHQGFLPPLPVTSEATWVPRSLKTTAYLQHGQCIDDQQVLH